MMLPKPKNGSKSQDGRPKKLRKLEKKKERKLPPLDGAAVVDGETTPEWEAAVPEATKNLLKYLLAGVAAAAVDVDGAVVAAAAAVEPQAGGRIKREPIRSRQREPRNNRRLPRP